jgi:hypothetical protein
MSKKELFVNIFKHTSYVADIALSEMTNDGVPARATVLDENMDIGLSIEHEFSIGPCLDLKAAKEAVRRFRDETMPDGEDINDAWDPAAYKDLVK